MSVQPQRRQPPTPGQVIAQQKRDAERLKQQKAQATRAVTVTPAAAPPATAAVDTRSEVEKYIDEVAPSSIAGKLIKFSKEGKFVIAETADEISPDDDFIALCDEVLVGWIRFHNDGETPPDRHQGLLYHGFVMPKRETLGDMDKTQWAEGLSGAPEDPWKHQMLLVLQSPATQELFTFATSSVTGRRAVGNLLRHYDRMQRTDTGSYPVVKLRPSGFQHKDDRVGWVSVPSFVVVNRAPKGPGAAPVAGRAPDGPLQPLSLTDDMNDQIPW